MMMTNRFVTTLLLLLSPTAGAAAAIIKNIRLASPLQALTIWDPEAPHKGETFRGRFLSKQKVGLEAEAKVRKQYEQKRQQLAVKASSGDNKNWAKRAKAVEAALYRAEEKAAERAFEQATKEFQKEQEQYKKEGTALSLLDSNNSNKRQQHQQPKKKNPNKFQFVGVIQPASRTASPPITWFARKKPRNAQWSVRLVHVNQQAIVKDMFRQGKIDVFGRYTNKGLPPPTQQQQQQQQQQAGDNNQQATTTASAAVTTTRVPTITSTYKVRQRSWRNLWNFSPKHLITDSSGHYWRERRLPPGLYTDGKTVFESSYRFRDGRNGMHKRSSLDLLLKSSAISKKTKDKLLKRLATDAPDLVLEDY